MSNMQYIVNNIKNANSRIINDIKILEFENFFPPEHLEKMMWATQQVHLIDSSEPVSGLKPSAFCISALTKDHFFRDINAEFKTTEFKTELLNRFGLNNVDYLMQYLDIDISIHTDQRHQFDDAHSDQKNNLFSLTLQIYLPETDENAEYGTIFFDNKGNELHTVEFRKNTGYCFMSHNNSWHAGKPGIERNSFFIRMDIKPHYEFTSSVFNYDSNIDTCYLIWDKYMEVPRHYTDYLLQVSMLNAQELGIENVVVSQDPWKNKCALLHKLKELGFKKAFIVLGGVHWNTKQAGTYAQELDLTVTVCGRSNSDSPTHLLRQYAVIDINKVIEFETTLPAYFPNTERYFGECVDKNDFIEIDDDLADIQQFYHMDEDIDECDTFTAWVRWSDTYEHDDIKYLEAYKENNRHLTGLTKSMHKG
tara:strand:- start:64 stop:1326 length:1263 start_codon:yes stop_codon:yes gene_type:complete